MIPAEAVEAAAKYIWLNSIKGRRTCEAWETLDESDKRPCREDAFAILETAAPHLFPQQCHSIDDGEQCLLKHDHGVAPTYRQHINGHVYLTKD